MAPQAPGPSHPEPETPGGDQQSLLDGAMGVQL